MLNSNKGGHIHIGITSSGQVEGVRVDFDARDGFRSGKKKFKKSPLSEQKNIY